jgi:hypothetical protein
MSFPVYIEFSHRIDPVFKLESTRRLATFVHNPTSRAVQLGDNTHLRSGDFTPGCIFCRENNHLFELFGLREADWWRAGHWQTDCYA